MVNREGWEWFTGFISGGIHRLPLNRDRHNAWIRPPEEDGWDYRWSIEDGTCGKMLEYGYADDLETAQNEAREAAETLGLL